MYWRINIGLFLLILSGCTQEKTLETDKQIVNEKALKSDYLIDASELKILAKQSNVKILDFRKKDSYEKEHLEGALPIWRTDIEDASYPYAGIMASPEQIENLFGRMGISTEDTLIIYDDDGLCNAARLWWILQNYDFTNVKLFEGGIKSWKENNGPVSTDLPIIEETVFKLTENPSMKYYISREDMQNALNSDIVILDTRSLDEYSGKRKKKGATKGGRIPNSVHIDWAEAIDYHGNKKFKPIQDLRAIYSELTISKDDPIIVYCHSGVRSAHTTFVLTQLLEYENVRNYDGSWIEWSSFNDLPFKKDSLTTINI